MDVNTAEERLEILDNGNHLGWVDVTNGTWSYSPPPLSSGLHRLMARYKGKETNAWNVTVQQADDVETFNSLAGLPDQPHSSLSFQFFSLIRKVGDAFPPAGDGPGFAGMKNASSGGSLGALIPPYMLVTVRVTDPSYPHRIAMVDMIFHKLYSVVRFDCFVRHEGSAVRISEITVLDDYDRELETQNVLAWPSNAGKLFRYGSPGSQNIRKIRFYIEAPGPAEPGGSNPREALWFDNVRMTP